MVAVKSPSSLMANSMEPSRSLLEEKEKGCSCAANGDFQAVS